VGEDEKGGDMRACKCEHWEVCPVCKPEWFDNEGNRLPPEPTHLQVANGVIGELRQQLAERTKQLVYSGDGWSDLVGSLSQQLAASQQALRNVYEVQVGISIPTNAVEKYLLTLIKQMRDAAKEGMK
jgi:hypothetical protein